MVAFSYGGLIPGLDLGEDDTNMQLEDQARDLLKKDNDAPLKTKEVNGLKQTPQQPLNLCLGTSECNTHMLRWETAWKSCSRERQL